MRDVTPREFLVRLEGGIELDVRAVSPEMACLQVAAMHTRLATAIISIGSDDADMAQVLGRCARCRAWMIGEPGALRERVPKRLKCGTCVNRKMPRPAQLPRLERPQRKERHQFEDGNQGGDNDYCT